MKVQRFVSKKNCPICNGPKKDLINGYILDGYDPRYIANLFGLFPQTIHSHMFHIKDLIFEEVRRQGNPANYLK